MRPNNFRKAAALSILLCVCIATPEVHSQDRVFSGGAAKSTVIDGHSQQQSPAWQTLNSGSQSSAVRNSSATVNNYANNQGAGTVVPAAYRPPVSPSSTDSPTQKSMPLEPPSELKSGEGKGTGGSTVQMFVSIGSSLLIVIGLFLGAAWFYKKTLSAPLGGGIPNQVVKVLGRTPIAARQHLVLVRFGSKLVLVSMIQGEARALSEITDPLEVDQLAGFCESQSAGSASQSFRNILNQGVMK